MTDIDGWWKGMRDTFTKLTKTKSGDALEDLPYKQNWILTKFAYLRERPTTNQDPVKSVSIIKKTQYMNLLFYYEYFYNYLSHFKYSCFLCYYVFSAEGDHS